MRTCGAVLLSLLIAFSTARSEQSAKELFRQAAAEFGVPAALLEGVGFVESHWLMLRPVRHATEWTHNPPPAYGIMGLRDDDWFGHSLKDAAALISLDPSILREDPGSNVRGGAALLASLARQHGIDPADPDLLHWTEVLARYSGIPQRTVQGEYVEDLFTALKSGFHQAGVDLPAVPVDMNRLQQILDDGFSASKVFSPNSDDYPLAVWDPSPNYSARASAITHVIIHDTEGSFASSVSWLQNPAAQASAHYIFRSSDGYLKQLVREADKAWHVRCWNDWTVGIEHEGYVAQPQYFTPVMYQQSALLVRALCDKYGITKDRLHIVGHNVWTYPELFPQLGWDNCNDHTDPGQYWNWDYFLALVVADSTPPSVVSHLPSTNQVDVPVYKTVSITFDRTMEQLSTQAAFSIFPDVPGTFAWSGDGKTLTFTPGSYLSSDAVYVVGVTTAAHSAGGGALDSLLQFGFTTAAPDNAGPTVAYSFPSNGMTDINAFMAFRVRFDEPVVFSSFANRVKFTDLADTTVLIGLGSVVYEDINDSGRVSFQATKTLAYGHSYRLQFLPGLSDILGNPSDQEKRIEFSIQAAPDDQGQVIDGFEVNGGQWQDPAAAPESNNLSAVGTSFTIAGAKKKSGSYAGLLTYAFTGADSGVCSLTAATPPAISLADQWVGFWVYGDFSRNELLLEFGTSGSPVSVSCGTIDWFGWKFVSVPISGIAGDVNALRSVIVRQNSGADRNGALYLDDLQRGTPTGVAHGPAVAPVAFYLAQNYPNPFNPSTVIGFVLDRHEHVTISVFNTLGQLVATVLDASLDAGQHTVTFDAGRDGGSLTSGVYIYRLQTASGSLVKKMLLLR